MIDIERIVGLCDAGPSNADWHRADQYTIENREMLALLRELAAAREVVEEVRDIHDKQRDYMIVPHSALMRAMIAYDQAVAAKEQKP